MLDAGLDRLATARLYVLVDGCSTANDFRALVEQLLEAGVDVVQLRDKLLADRALLERARLLREVTRQHNALFIMNDRVDLAAMSQADGVHLGQEEVPVQDARSVLGCQALIGVSTHSITQRGGRSWRVPAIWGAGRRFPRRQRVSLSFPAWNFCAR